MKVSLCFLGNTLLLQNRTQIVLVTIQRIGYVKCIFTTNITSVCKAAFLVKDASFCLTQTIWIDSLRSQILC